MAKKKSSGLSGGMKMSGGGVTIVTPEGKALEKQEKQQKAVQTAQAQAAGQAPVTYTNQYVTQQATKVDPYQSAYNDIIKQRAEQIANRDPFSYNFNEDPLYQNYKDQYQRQATLGQESAMANAAALSGGYGSSYATTAGNLAYQENMAQLNNVIPQLYQMAYDKYNTDLANQRADLEMYQNMDNTEYGRYIDQLNDTRWGDQFRADQYNTGMNYASTEHQRGIDNKLNEKQLAEQIRSNKAGEKLANKQFKWEQKKWKKEFALSKKANAGGSSGGGGGRYYRGSGTNQNSIPQKYYNKIWSAVAKYQGGNGPQGEIANNVLKGLRKKYGLTSSKYDAAFDRIYNGRLGFNDKDQNREYNKKVYNSKGAKYQTREQAMKAGASKNTVTYEQYLSYCQSGNKNYTKYSSYSKYLAAMVKKGKK